MMVSTKGRYALRVMLDLAMQKQEEYVSLNDCTAAEDFDEISGIDCRYAQQGGTSAEQKRERRRLPDGTQTGGIPGQRDFEADRRDARTGFLHGRGRLRPGVRASGELPDQTDVESTGRNYRRISFQRIDPGSAGWEVLTLRRKWKG